MIGIGTALTAAKKVKSAVGNIFGNKGKGKSNAAPQHAIGNALNGSDKKVKIEVPVAKLPQIGQILQNKA